MEQLITLPGFAASETRLRSALARVRRLELSDGHGGSLRVKRRSARVTLEPGDWICTSLVIDQPPAPDDALRMNQHLPGNVRCVRDSKRLILLADTRPNGCAHLERTFEDIRSGMAQALHTRPVRRRSAVPLPVEEIQGIFDKLPWHEESVVQRGDHWELHPRIGRTSLPVCLALTDRGVWFYRTLLKQLPTGEAREAVVDQALRLNGQIRLARLAIVDEALVVESYLHEGQVNAHWFGEAALAVAVASQHTQRVLRVLAEQESLARCYVATVCRGGNCLVRRSLSTDAVSSGLLPLVGKRWARA